jgi:hypothetical protein
LILERNRLGYAHGGDRRSWQFSDKEWRHQQEYIEKGRLLDEKAAAREQAEKAAAQDQVATLPLEKTQDELAAQAQVSKRTISDA